MNIHTLQMVLEETFNANFVAYYRAHVAHVNIIGRNFQSDHKLLQKIYEDLQGNIDILAELLRTIRTFMPDSLQTVIMRSPITEAPISGDADDLLEQVLADQKHLLDIYKELNEAAEEVGYVDISNYAQARVGDHAKFRWMLEATLGIDVDPDEEESDDDSEY
jgi:starvation-inducible DNA-binding protein